MHAWMNAWMNYGWERGHKPADFWLLYVLTTNPHCISFWTTVYVFQLSQNKTKKQKQNSFYQKMQKILSWLQGGENNNNNNIH